MRNDLDAFARDIKEKAKEAVEPAMRRLQHLSDSQIEWRVKWSVFGFLTCIAITIAASWVLSPSPHIMIDAGRWRTWQESNFTKDQADRINKLLKEIEEENAKKAQAESERKKRDDETPLGS